ncbi:L,D-transpeptidase [Variovorax ureilyticus]|uniref:L,D-transpeptidase n=1 Tax=Variovorax ureilyticus TaxID=1836198 RepID=UPI003D6649B9
MIWLNRMPEPGFDNAGMKGFRTPLLALAGAICFFFSTASLSEAPPSPQDLIALYRSRVDRALAVPADEVGRYRGLAETALRGAQADLSSAQYLLVVDRDPKVQAALLFWRSESGEYRFIGASPVSTGRPGTFDHFETPEGVFVHSPSNPDFRAEGTFNSNGIRGYGRKGMRVYDLGWQRVPKGWGDGATIDMRLQMHATEPDSLEHRLGSAQSKGCVRIPATLNTLLDHYGVLDAEYERLVADGQAFWVLKEDRETVADPGRYIVIVDSGLAARAPWTLPPKAPPGAGQKGG